jgi:hypothetical protein
MSFHVSKYRLHKGRGQALAQVGGHRIDLGKYGSTRSKEKSRRVVAEALAKGSMLVAVRTGGPFCLKPIKLEYKEHFSYDLRFYRATGRSFDKATSARCRSDDGLYFCLPETGAGSRLRRGQGPLFAK